MVQLIVSGLGFPFFFWGSDGSSEAQRGGQGEAPPPAGPSDGGAAGVAGGAAAGTAAGMSEDEQIYGRQPDRPVTRDDDYPAQQEGMEGYDEQSGWGDEGDVLEDPWAQEDLGDDGGGWFGGGGDWGGFGGSDS